MNENPAQKVEMTVQIQWWPGADTANKVRGAISVIFSSQVSLHFHHCKRDEVYFTTSLWQNSAQKYGLISRMQSSDWYKIMLNEVTFVGFMGAIAPPGSAPAPITYLLSSLCNCTVCTCQELALSKAPVLLTTPNSLLHSDRRGFLSF